MKWLLNASTVSAKQNLTVNLCILSFYSFALFTSLCFVRFCISYLNSFLVLKLNISKPLPITELDESVAREFFTILNNSKLYTDDQLFNIHTFSMLYCWLKHLYFIKLDSLSNFERNIKLTQQTLTNNNNNVSSNADSSRDSTEIKTEECSQNFTYT
jgi:hypothetical protein